MMAMARSRWLQLLLLVSLQSLLDTIAAQTGVVYRIDCGGTVNFTSPEGEEWLADSFYSGGSSARLSTDGPQQEQTIRYFPPQFGSKNCYQVPVPNGRYYIRMYFTYKNYDKKKKAPTFDVSVEGTIVFSWDSQWEDDPSLENGTYPDLYAFVNDGQATICFHSTKDVPLVGALEIVQVDTDSYDSADTGTDVILVTYGRVTASLETFGAGATSDGGEGGRVWYPALEGVHGEWPSENLDHITVQNPIANATVAPNYFPLLLYQNAITGAAGEDVTYLKEVDINGDYAIWLHFAELDGNVQVGGRVFDVIIDGDIYFQDMDIRQQAGGAFTALDRSVRLINVTSTVISLILRPKVGKPPLICGVEIYGVSQMDLATDVLQAGAMASLKTSLQIPERMGWNGDPCAPSDWDTWEGVVCVLQNNSFVISQLEVPSAGLKGFIHNDIILLSNLDTLNLSNNNLQGVIPFGLGTGDLKTVDLSDNQLSGNIPSSLGSQQLTTVLLDNNQLSGAVPVSLYSLGLRGGTLNLLSNAGLCGVGGLPSCRESLSTGAKVGIALGAIMVSLLAVSLLYLFIQRRRRNDYTFRVSPRSKSKGVGRYAAKLRTNFDEMKIMRNVPSRFGFSNLTPL